MAHLNSSRHGSCLERWLDLNASRAVWPSASISSYFRQPPSSSNKGPCCKHILGDIRWNWTPCWWKSSHVAGRLSSGQNEATSSCCKSDSAAYGSTCSTSIFLSFGSHQDSCRKFVDELFASITWCYHLWLYLIKCTMKHIITGY